MTYIAPDKWTCPRCRHTVTFDGPPEYVAVARMAEQKRHGKAHRENALLEMRLRKLNPHRSLRSQGAA